ncbi:MAG: RagB/SusD family nutrient uptake outer membrane protein [Bacteroidota bacterium]
MKKIQHLLMTGSLLMALLVATSCNNDFLDTEPLDKVSSEATWSDAALAEAFVFGVYSYLGYGGFEEQGLSSYTDEAMFTHAGRPIPPLNEGTESPTNLAYMSPTYNWPDMYLAIRQANIALTELANSPIDKEAKDRLMGEAHFLRAYYYQQLLRFYGGVPIIDQAYGLDEDYEVERSSYSDVVDFIVSDLDAASSLLDGKMETPGRASKLAAMALKGRVLMYAASDLHEASKVSGSDVALDNELFAYSGGQDARWQAAKAATKAALDAGVGYKLDLSAPVSLEEGRANYLALSMGGGSAVADASAAVELILQRTATVDYTVESRWPLGGLHHGINNGPNGYNNWAGNTPIQQLVDDYEMMDGSRFDWSNPDHADAPYVDRDPRFYSTILYDGADWKPRPPAVAPLDPMDQIQSGFYDDGNGGIVNGIDTRQSTIENWNGTRTAYYTRKFTDPDPAVQDNFSGGQTIPFPFIRYTEVVLNYVEACLETGDEATARDWLNRIRFRAGMPAINDSGQDLVDRYRNERRIELVYEEHRYHDARRWLIAAETLGRGIEAMNVQATLKPGATPHVPYRHDPEVYDYEYNVFDNTEVETRTWVDRMYYRPINRDEMNRNSALVQNPGYN